MSKIGKREFLKNRVYQMGQWLELVISFLIVIAIIFYAGVLCIELFHLITGKPDSIENLSDFTNRAFDLVIGIEFIKMLCKHSPTIVVEVLLFAVARQMIVEHMSPVQNLVSILCIAILFAIRRYLFFNHDTDIAVVKKEK
jgi:uncharacterized membrane protein (DUF373 family)